MGSKNRRMNKASDKEITNKLFLLVEEHANISKEAIVSRSRLREVVIARKIIVKLLCDNTTLVLKAIGQAVGKIDHATTIHHRDKFDRDFVHLEGYAKLYSKVKHGLNLWLGADVVDYLKELDNIEVQKVELNVQESFYKNRIKEFKA